jgi:hypothetical protein
MDDVRNALTHVAVTVAIGRLPALLGPTNPAPYEAA